jgi:hypothetical protein
MLLFAAMGSDGFLRGTTSRGFHGWIAEYVGRIHAGEVHGWNWLGPNVSLLPLPSWLWTLNGLIFGELAALTSVLSQGLLDSGTCVLIYLLAREIDSRYAMPAGVAAAINPTQVVMANLYYTDPVFLFFLALAMLAAVRWLQQPTLRAALVIGTGFGGAMLCRVVVAPWAVFAGAYLLVALALQRRLQRRHLAQLLASGLITAACTAPIVARNHANTGEWILTTQTGSHSAFWVVPLVMQARDGTPWERGAAAMKQRIEARYGPDTGGHPREFPQAHRSGARGAGRAGYLVGCQGLDLWRGNQPGRPGGDDLSAFGPIAAHWLLCHTGRLGPGESLQLSLPVGQCRFRMGDRARHPWRCRIAPGPAAGNDRAARRTPSLASCSAYA